MSTIPKTHRNNVFSTPSSYLPHTSTSPPHQLDNTEHGSGCSAPAAAGVSGATAGGSGGTRGSKASLSTEETAAGGRGDSCSRDYSGGGAGGGVGGGGGGTNLDDCAGRSNRSDISSNVSDDDMGGVRVRCDAVCNSFRCCFFRECPLCLDEVLCAKFPRLQTCSHLACETCFKQYLAMEITESRVNITCPKCNELMHPSDIHHILRGTTLPDKYEDFMLRRVLATEQDVRWCPAPDCGYAVIAAGCASCPKLQCERPGCGSFFCYHCKAEWHPNQTCDTARVERAPHPQYYRDENDVKACPCCQVLIVKMDDGSCNHMTCSVCGAEFCWLCMKEVSDLHYLSPSGCTFWGKKPWSRKKKAMWQLGTLVGAPLGIALLAGLAVPAIVIGIPIWAGRKIYTKYSSAGRHKRNMMVVCGVMWSSLLSPVVAGVAVSIGVPILLAYVYGVVPISLCRSGGCGVITSASGVRIAFGDDGDNPALAATNLAMSGAAAMRNFAKLNDSLPPAEGGARDGPSTASAEPEREPISVAAALLALAGPGGGANCFSPRSHKLEVHVEMGGEGPDSVATRAGDTASLAVSDTNTETASTRGLAGSIAHYKGPGHSEVVSLVGVRNVARAGDSASTVMESGDSVSIACGIGGDSVSTAYGIGDSVSTAGGDSVSTAGAIIGFGGGVAAAPSILSSISATTTTNLFMPPSTSGACSSSSTRRCSKGRRYDTTTSGEEDYDEEDEIISYGGSGCKRGDCLEGTYINGRDLTGRDCILNGSDPRLDRNAALNGSDPRLDSVSAIITARKLSAHSKGVTFSIGSASSQSRDHISLNLDDPEATSLSGKSVTAVSGLTGVHFGSDRHFLPKTADQMSYNSDLYSSNEKDLLVEGDRHEQPNSGKSWSSPNSSNFNTHNKDNNSSTGKVGPRKVCIGPHMDYREVYGECHYDGSKLECYDDELSDGIRLTKASFSHTNLDVRSSFNRNKPPVLVYFSEGSNLHQVADRGHHDSQPASSPLERHRSVPENYNIASGGSPRAESLPKFEVSIR